MITIREVTVEGIPYDVIISDEQETLSAAQAAGRVSVGLLHEDGCQNLSGTEYLVTSLDAVDEVYLEHVVRRFLGLPWIIGESDRLCIREFVTSDAYLIPEEADETPEDAVFHSPEKLAAYIQGQYRFYEYGIWAVVRKEDGAIVGTAGVSDCDILRDCKGIVCSDSDACRNGAESYNQLQLELGYHIFTPYRRQGYAMEACRLIITYVRAELGTPLFAVTERNNLISRRILMKLGFTEFQSGIHPSTEQKYTQSAAPLYRCVLY